CRLDTYRVDWTRADGGGYKLVRSTTFDYKIGNKILINDKGKTVSRSSVQEFRRKNDMHSSGTFHILVATDGDVDGMIERIKKYAKIDVSVLPLEYLSKYEVKDVKTREKVKRGTSEVHLFNRSNQTWHKERINRDDGKGVYVSLTERRSVLRDEKDGNRLSSWNLSKILAFCDIDSDVYGIKDEVIDKLGSGFEPLSERIAKK